MILSDPEVESAVLISSDEGASFEKYPINFHILSLLFHPAQENWILAYSHDNKVDQKVKELSSRKVSLCDVMITVLLIPNIYILRVSVLGLA